MAIPWRRIRNTSKRNAKNWRSWNGPSNNRSPLLTLARGSMRTYLIYKEKARRWNADKEIRAIVRELGKAPSNGLPKPNGYSRKAAGALKDYSFDRRAMGARGLMYERLDQLTVEVILGVR